MNDHPEIEELNVREKIVRIDQMIADIQRSFVDRDRIFADNRRTDADHDRKRQEIRYAPWLAMIAGMTAGAAFFAAGVAFVKLLG
jgi:hypothetical protein